MRRKLRILRSKLWRREKALKIERAKCTELKCLIKEMKEQPCFCTKLSVTQKTFLKSQVKANSTAKSGMRWTREEKCNAVNLYLRSPNAYAHQQKLWRLPSKATIHRIVAPIFETVRDL